MFLHIASSNLDLATLIFTVHKTFRAVVFEVQVHLVCRNDLTTSILALNLPFFTSLVFVIVKFPRKKCLTTVSPLTLNLTQSTLTVNMHGYPF